MNMKVIFLVRNTNQAVSLLPQLLEHAFKQSFLINETMTQI